MDTSSADITLYPTVDQVLTAVHDLDPTSSLPKPENFSWGDSWMLRLLTGTRR
jgi:hypothetical protein